MTVIKRPPSRSVWIVELVTNEFVCNSLEIEAGKIEKVDYYTLVIDDVVWKLPEGIGLSFAEVTEERE